MYKNLASLFKKIGHILAIDFLIFKNFSTFFFQYSFLTIYNQQKKVVKGLSRVAT
jgi:hypothetical protein